MVDDEIVARWVRTLWGVRPLVAHAAWRTDPDTAAWLVLETSTGSRTPAPLREARRLARTVTARLGVLPPDAPLRAAQG